MAITLRQLSYFAALAEEGSFVRAAARVNVTQPALSMQIKEMEEQLGLLLVERGSRETRLTPAGRDVLQRGARVLAEVREIEGIGRRQGQGGRVNLGIIPTVAPYLLPPVLARMGGVSRELRLREARTERLLEELGTGALDAVVIARPAARDADLAAERLFTDRFVLAGSAARMSGLRVETLRPVALDPDHLLLLDEGHCLADQALEVCGLTRRQMRVDLGASSLSTLVGLVAQGFGLTFLPEIALRVEAAAAPGMRLARFAAPEPAREIALVRRQATPREGWFTELAEVMTAASQELLEAADNLLPPRGDALVRPG
jgi:LysR family hydrogen peroxide-inducible transcriptional activator